jgi:hypothetical protein
MAFAKLEVTMSRLPCVNFHNVNIQSAELSDPRNIDITYTAVAVDNLSLYFL